MQRHEPIIQLSDHVKNKLKQHRYPVSASPLINSSDEFLEIQSIDDDNDLASLRFTPPENETRPRRDTYTTFDVKQATSSFFTDRKSNFNPDISRLQEKSKKPQTCEECFRRDLIISLERQDLLYVYNQNKQLINQLRSSILLNHQYKDDIQKLRSHLTKVNSHLYEYQINFDHLKQKILSNKKQNQKKDEEEEEEVEDEGEEDKQDVTVDHIKRLRYEIQMYNRIVAAKEKQEEKYQQKQMDFLF